MKIGITLETNLGGIRNVWIHNLSDSLNDHFKDKSFGDDLKELLIGIIVVAPEFDFFFKVRKPKYRQGKKVLTLHGNQYEVEDSVGYDVKLDYSKYSSYQEDEFMSHLKSEIFSSIQILNQIKRLKKFDFEAFAAELEGFLKK